MGCLRSTSQVDTQLVRLKKVCEERSAAGQFDATFQTNISRRGSCLAKGPANDQDLRIMTAALKKLGFPSVDVQKVPPFALRLEVSWKACQADEPPKKRARGATHICIVCAQMKAMVVLAPCGHVMCEACNEKKPKKNECPFCREGVICVTNGLFMAGA